MSKNAFTVTVRIEPDGRQMTVKGRDGWALRELIKAGQRGCTPITHPGPRWSAYVFKLRAMGFVVETINEAHDGPFSGNHARYLLHTECTLLDDEGPRQIGEAA